MKRILLFGGVALGLALAGLFGCGDDDVTNPELKTGELDDPEFLAAVQALDQSGVDDVAKEMYYGFQDFVWSIFMDFGPGTSREVPHQAQQGPIPVMWYDETTGYWHRVRSGAELGWGIMEDSLQFMTASGPSPLPAEDSLTECFMGSSEVFGENADTNLFRSRLYSFAWGGPDNPVLTLNGSQTTAQHAMITIKQAQLTAFEVSATSKVTGAVLDPSVDPVCPDGGEVTSTVTILTSWSTGDTILTFNGVWHIGQTFSTDSTIVVMDNGSTQWTYIEYCVLREGLAGFPMGFLNRRH